jgi:hypothetical protein
VRGTLGRNSQSRRRHAYALALFSAFSLCPMPAQAVDDAGWVLTQRSITLGDQYVYISPNGLKCENPKIGVAFVTHAPDWTITIYNEKTRVFYHTSIEGYKQELQARGLTADLQDRVWQAGGKQITICGLVATEYKMSGTNTLHGHKNTSVNVSDAEYWVSQKIAIPKMLSALFSAMYGLPVTTHYPLRLQVQEKGEEKVYLDTYRTQQAAIPVTYFEAPSGLTPVKSDAEVYMTDEQNAIIHDMAADLGPDASATPAAPAAPTRSAMRLRARRPTAQAQPETIDVGGVKLDKNKVQRFVDAL